MPIAPERFYAEIDATTTRLAELVSAVHSVPVGP